MTAGTLSLSGITRRFRRDGAAGAADQTGHVAVDNLSLDVASGELLALIGASGSGKTTTLRIVAGYETPDLGRVILDGRDITAVPAHRRDFGMVFQHYALFPHMSVGENVAFGLEARGVAKAERAARAERVLASVGLGGAASRPVQSLSGGEQQRVALARALVIEPRVLLLDEPLSNLDPTLRRSTREELRATLHRLGVTALFVTHDQEDAFAVADRLALIRSGRLLQVGTPEELYDRPSSRDVAEFIGRSTLVPASMVTEDTADISIGGRARRVRVVVPVAESTPPSTSMLAVLRPDSLALGRDDDRDAWPGVVTNRRFAGSLLAYHVKLAGNLEVEVYGTDRHVRDGDRVAVRIQREPVALVSADSA
ncbi:MAG: ABC transporter ATP-binding protein [Gemmatimonadaceae bacterium]